MSKFFYFKSMLNVVPFVLLILSTNYGTVWSSLSDKRLCADPECQKIISTGVTKITYNAVEDGMLSFRINQPVRIKSKSAGSNPNLWGIEVNGRQGYVVKDFITEKSIIYKDEDLKFEVDVAGTPTIAGIAEKLIKPSEKVETKDGGVLDTTTVPLNDLGGRNARVNLEMTEGLKDLSAENLLRDTLIKTGSAVEGDVRGIDENQTRDGTASGENTESTLVKAITEGPTKGVESKPTEAPINIAEILEKNAEMARDVEITLDEAALENPIKEESTTSGTGSTLNEPKSQENQPNLEKDNKTIPHAEDPSKVQQSQNSNLNASANTATPDSNPEEIIAAVASSAEVVPNPENLKVAEIEVENILGNSSTEKQNSTETSSTLSDSFKTTTETNPEPSIANIQSATGSMLYPSLGMNNLSEKGETVKNENSKEETAEASRSGVKEGEGGKKEFDSKTQEINAGNTLGDQRKEGTQAQNANEEPTHSKVESSNDPSKDPSLNQEINDETSKVAPQAPSDQLLNTETVSTESNSQPSIDPELQRMKQLYENIDRFNEDQGNQATVGAISQNSNGINALNSEAVLELPESTEQAGFTGRSVPESTTVTPNAFEIPRPRTTIDDDYYDEDLEDDEDDGEDGDLELEEVLRQRLANLAQTPKGVEENGISNNENQAAKTETQSPITETPAPNTETQAPNTETQAPNTETQRENTPSNQYDSRSDSNSGDETQNGPQTENLTPKPEPIEVNSPPNYYDSSSEYNREATTESIPYREVPTPTPEVQEVQQENTPSNYYDSSSEYNREATTESIPYRDIPTPTPVPEQENPNSHHYDSSSQYNREQVTEPNQEINREVVQETISVTQKPAIYDDSHLKEEYLKSLHQQSAHTEPPSQVKERSLFSTIYGTVRGFISNDKKYADSQHENELDRILFSGGDEKKIVPDLHQQYCSAPQTAAFSFDNFLQSLATNILKQSELVLCFAVTAATILLFVFGYYCFCNSSRESNLLSKLNLLERSMLASQKENAILKNDLSATRKKLSSIEDNSFGSNDMVMSLKTELDAEKLEKTKLQEQIANLEKELENAAEAGLELNRIVSELLNNQTGEESIISSVEELQKQLNEQQQTIMEINANLAEKSRENSELLLLIAEQKASLGSRITALEQDNDELEQDKSMLQTRVDELLIQFDEDITKALEGKNNEIKRLQNEIYQLTNKYEEEHNRLQTNHAKVEALEECLKALKKGNNNNKVDQLMDVANVRAELLDIQKKYSHLKESFDAASESKSLAENQLSSLTADYEKIKEEYHQSEKDKLEAQTRLEVLSSYFKDKEAQLQKELSLKETMWFKQQGEATSTVERLTAMQEEIQSLKSQNDSLRAEIEAQIAAHKAQTGTLENRAHETWLAARQADRRYEEARAEAASLRRKLTTLAAFPNESSVVDTQQANQAGEMNSLPSPVKLEPPSSPLLGRLPPPPPFLPPHFMAPPPAFIGMPPPFLAPGEMRPPPLGRIMSPQPPPEHHSNRFGRYSVDPDEEFDPYDDDDDVDDDDMRRAPPPRRREHDVWNRSTYSPPRTYRSHSPPESRYDFDDDRDFMSNTYDTETDLSPPNSPKRGGHWRSADEYDEVVVPKSKLSTHQVEKNDKRKHNSTSKKH